MRTGATILLGVLFVAGFTGYFIGAAVVGHLGDKEAVVHAAREGDLHGVVVDVIEASLRDEIDRRTPDGVSAEVDAALRPLIAQVLTEKWTYETFEIAYGGFAEVVSERYRDEEVNLSERLDELRARLYSLGDKAVARCRALTGEGGCPDAAAAVHAYRGSVDEVLGAIPTQTSLAGLIDDLGPRFLPKAIAQSRSVKDGARLLRIIRWSVLGFIGLIGIIILLINLSPAHRALVALGAILLIAAGLNLIIVGLIHSELDDTIRQVFATRIEALAPHDPVARVAVLGSERVLHTQLAHAFSGRALLLTLWLLAGAALATAGVVLRRREG